MKSTYRSATFAAVLGAVLAAAILPAADPRPNHDLTFDHFTHTAEAGLQCAECHAGMESLPAGGRARPGHSTCESCHDVQSGSECAVCHRHPDAVKPLPLRGEGYAGFAHKSHIDKGLDCATCHGRLDFAGAVPSVPVMADCQSCHLLRRAPVGCEQCHQGKRPLPAEHQLATWRQDHGWEASAATTDCASCHSQSSCDQCHQGLNLYGSPHPPGWVFSHYADAAWGAECLSCHETRRSCTDCHRRSLPLAHPLGPDWANRTTGGEHRNQAEAFMESCLACHDLGAADPTCAKCHR